MDVKAFLKAIEDAGLKLATDEVAPLTKQLIDLGLECAKKGVSTLSHKAGVADVTEAQ